MVGALGRTPDEVAAEGHAAYPSYNGEWVWAYADLFPSLDIGSLPPHGTFNDLVAQGALSENEIIEKFTGSDPGSVTPAYLAANAAGVAGILRTEYDLIAPASQADYNTAYQTDQAARTAAASAPAAPVDPTTQVFLQNGQNVDGNGTPYPPDSPHYYNALLDMIEQTEAQGGMPGAVTASEGALAKSNPALVDNLPPDVLQLYGTAFDAVLHRGAVPAGSTGGPSGTTTGPASAGPVSPGTGGGSSAGGLPMPSSDGGNNPFGIPGASDASSGSIPAGGATAEVSLLAGIPGGGWGLAALAGLGLAVVARKRKG
jgi:hypothetical protein